MRAVLAGLLALLLEVIVMKAGLELLLMAKSAPRAPDSASKVTRVGVGGERQSDSVGEGEFSEARVCKVQSTNMMPSTVI
jgi:hypothetical protein